MEKIDKMHLMDKILRELADVANRQKSLLKKITQCEADNINLGNTLLEKNLPDIHEKIDMALTDAIKLQTDFTAVRDKFIIDNKLNEVLPEANT